MDAKQLSSVQETVCLHRLSASQKPPALLRMIQQRARWFHDNPTRSPLLASLEEQTQFQQRSSSA